MGHRAMRVDTARLADAAADLVERPDPARMAALRHHLTVVSADVRSHRGFTVSPRADGTAVTYSLRVRLDGWWRLAAPVLRRTGPWMVAPALEVLRRQLDEQGPESRDTS